MISISGDLLKQTTGLLVHGVNCQGVMGKGIALSIRKKYPQVFVDYKKFCKENKELLGKVIYTKITEELVIASLFSQQYYGNKPNTRYVDYNAIELGFLTIASDIKENNREDMIIKIPKIGATNGGGDWETIKQIIIDSTNNLNVELYIL